MSISHRDLSLCKQGFHRQCKNSFQCSYLFCHCEFDYFIQYALVQYKHALVPTESLFCEYRGFHDSVGRADVWYQSAPKGLGAHLVSVVSLNGGRFYK